MTNKFIQDVLNNKIDYASDSQPHPHGTSHVLVSLQYFIRSYRRRDNKLYFETGAVWYTGSIQASPYQQIHPIL